MFAALDVAAAQVQAQCQNRHRSEEFLRFLDGVIRHYPQGAIHLVMDNVSTPKSKKVHQWLTRHPRVSLHCTQTYASWLNLVEIFFNLVQSKVLARGIFPSKADLVAKLLAFVEKFNREGTRFQWTKPPQRILQSLERLSGH